MYEFNRCSYGFNRCSFETCKLLKSIGYPQTFYNNADFYNSDGKLITGSMLSCTDLAMSTFYAAPSIDQTLAWLLTKYGISIHVYAPKDNERCWLVDFIGIPSNWDTQKDILFDGYLETCNGAIAYVAKQILKNSAPKENPFTLRKAWRHFKTIMKHKWYVGKFCFKFGLYWQGITHDISKLSPTEFIESVKYYTGTSSPIVGCKTKNGISIAWQHHKGHNPHHYEYWIDKIDEGGMMQPMPLKYILEMIADWYGAKIAYSNGRVDHLYESEIQWWKDKKKNCAMHPATQKMVDFLLDYVSVCEDKKISLKKSKNPYWVPQYKFYLKEQGIENYEPFL